VSSITIVIPHFAPESNAGAKRITALADLLVTKGWHVVVVTQLPHQPQNSIYAGYDVATPHVTETGGLKIIRLKPWIVSKQSLVLRLLSESVFTLRAFPHLLRARTDVILASSPYMFLGPLAYLVALVRSKPFAWDVRDLTWQYPSASGKRTFGLDLLLAQAMKFTGRRADLLTATTQGQLDYFGRVRGAARVVPNGVTRQIYDALSQLPAPFAPGRPRAQVGYVGLFGFNHATTKIVEAARQLPDVDFVFVGDGPDRGVLEDAAHELANVTVKPYMAFSELVAVYEGCDVLVSQFRRSPVFKWVQAAKVWEYLATGRPVIHAGEGETAEVLEENNIGVAVEPENPTALATAIQRLLADPRAAREMGERGREFVRASRIREDTFESVDSDLRVLVAGQETTNRTA